MRPLSFKIRATIRYFFVGKLRAPITVSKLHIIVATTVNISAYFKCILTAVHVKMKPRVTIQGVPRDLNSVYIYIYIWFGL